tara:strand:+ start:1330 stop:2379 length:1050 start_codon:yes stop_codon:yes gene_type:complete
MNKIISTKIKSIFFDKNKKQYTSHINNINNNIYKGEIIINLDFFIYNQKKCYIGNKKFVSNNTRDFKFIKERELLKSETDYKTEPFFEKERKHSSVNIKNIFYKNIGTYDSNEFFLQEDVDAFKDTQHSNIVRNTLKEDPFNPNYDYPIIINHNKIHRQGGRIDHFKILDEITLEKNFKGVSLGIKKGSLSNGKDVLGNNIKITGEIYKHQKKQFIHYEDDIDEKYIFNNIKELKIKKTQKIFVDGDFYIESETFLEEKFSKEPRYFINPKSEIDFTIEPYKDASHKSENYWDYNLKPDIHINMYKKLLNARSKNEYYKENRVFSSRGRSIDYSENIGIESISFSDLIN